MPTFLPTNSFTYCTLYGSSTLEMSYDGNPNTATMFGVNSNCITAWWNWPGQSPTAGICNLVGVSIYPYKLTSTNGNYISAIGNAQDGSIGSTLKSGPIYLPDGVFTDIYFDDPVLTNGFWVSIRTSGSDANIGGIIEIRGIWDYDWERTPSSISFPTTSVGVCTTLGAHNIQITNKSTVSKQFTFSSNSADFVPSSGALIVGAGATGNKPIQFCPTSSGNKSGSISITCTGFPSGSCTSPSSTAVSVSGTGTASYTWVLLDQSHNFGDVTINDYSAWYPSGVKNNSTVTLNFTVSSDSTNFEVSPSSFSATPGGWGYFDVRFHPTAQQYYSATLLVTCSTSGASPPSSTMTVSGTGVSTPVYPKIVCDSSISDNCVSPFEFGDVDVGSGHTRFFYIANIQTGGTSANCTCSLSGTNADQFTLTTTSLSILPDTTESVEISFTPTGIGIKTATLTVSCSNCASGYNTVTTSLQGNGMTSTPYATITNMTCGSTQTHPGDIIDVMIEVTVQNTGDATGQFKIRIDPDIECAPFALNSGDLTTRYFDVSTYYDYSPYQFLAHASCYRLDTWIDDDMAECNVIINYTEGEINMGSSFFYAEFAPDQQSALIADISLRNSGNAIGLVYTRYLYRTTGDWLPLTSVFQDTISAGASILAHHLANIPSGLLGSATFGVKVWGQDETEPLLPNEVITFGACCNGIDCSQTTQSNCTGTFKGVGVPCIPNPCTCVPATKENGRFDVDKDGLITWKDVQLIWDNRTSPTVPYNEYYDMNCDGVVNYLDVQLCNSNKDIPAASCEDVPDEQTCLQINCYWYNGSCHGEPNNATLLAVDPSGDGSHPYPHSTQGCSSHYQCVDDLVTLEQHDGDATYLHNSFTGGAETDQEKWDRLKFVVPTMSGTINSVTTVVTARKTSSAGNCNVQAGIFGVKKNPDGGTALTTEYQDFTFTQTDKSGSPIQWSDLTSTTTEVDSYIWYGSTGGTQSIRITSVYIIINYTP